MIGFILIVVIEAVAFNEFARRGSLLGIVLAIAPPWLLYVEAVLTDRMTRGLP